MLTSYVSQETMDAELLRKYIFSGHVGEYMEVMEEDDNELYLKHFSQYLEHEVTNENLEETWQKVLCAFPNHSLSKPIPHNLLKTNTCRPFQSSERSSPHYCEQLVCTQLRNVCREPL